MKFRRVNTRAYGTPCVFYLELSGGRYRKDGLAIYCTARGLHVRGRTKINPDEADAYYELISVAVEQIKRLSAHQEPVPWLADPDCVVEEQDGTQMPAVRR